MAPFNRSAFAAALAAALSVLVAGCGTTREVTGSIQKERSEVDVHRAQIEASKSVGWVVRDKGINLVGGEIEIASGKPEPEWMGRSYVYVTADQRLPEILSVLSREIGIHAQLAEDASREMAAGTTEALPFHVSWSGNVKGFLNHLGLRTGLHWKHENGRILFFKEETKNYNVYLPGGSSALSASISLSGAAGGGSSGGASGGSGGSGGSTVSVSSTTKIDAYESLLKSVQSMVGEAATTGKSSAAGGKVSINPSLGILTVTAPPPVQERVAEFVRGVNERFARNVMINVKIYNLALKRDENTGVQVNDLITKFADRVATGISLRGAPPLPPSSGGTPGTLILDRESSYRNATRESGTSSVTALLQALSQHGDVSLVTSGQVIAANGQPSPLQVGSEVSYLASSSTTATTNVGTTTTLTPGKQSVGFTANFLPTLLGDNRILLQYQINLSSLLSLDQVTSGDASIQTPNVATQSLQQQAFLKDGQSIVLFGFESSRSTYDKSHGLTGASQNASGNRQMMVIVMEVFSGQG